MDCETQVTKFLQKNCVCNLTCWLSFFTSLFPVLSWLPKYKLEYLIPDIISGFTISVLHIPQGMAYGVLGGVSAENGLYVSFFPVLVYVLLGTSFHISIGTFAINSLMLHSTITMAGGVERRALNSTLNTSDVTTGTDYGWPPTNIEISTTLAMTCGFWQLCMGVLQLGSLTVVMSDQLVSGFSTGAACHVAVSQFKDLFGINSETRSGVLNLVYMLRDIFADLVNTNGATVIVSAISIFVLGFFKEQVDPRLKDKLPVPIPIDLILVIIGTAISYLINLNKNYKVDIIEEIPTGLPSPVPPRMDIIYLLIGDGLAIAVVAYVITLSMSKILAQKNKYYIRPNQELLALGSANVFASFFACYPSGASLSRSMVQERAGGKTQIAGLVSCCLLLIVLLVLAPLFYSLPKCILSCIILVALKPMFLQVKDFFQAWGISKLDALIWLVSCLGTIFLDIVYGLMAAVLFSLLTVIIRTVIPSKTFLGRIPDTDIYLDPRRFKLATEIEGMKIFHFESALYFINKEIFKSTLYKHVPPRKSDTPVKNENERIHRIIIDCSTYAFVDMSGLDTLIEIMKEYQDVGISVFLAGCSISMLSVMENAKFIKKVPLQPSIFLTIHDAVKFQFSAHATVLGS